VIYRFICILFLALSLSCSGNSSPQGILEENLMVSILVEIQLTEGKVSSLPVTYDSSQVLYSLMEKDIFSKHGVTDSVFTTSMEYYLEDAEKMDRIYARVIDSLVVLENNTKTKE
jgi:ATP sulfurylase